MMVTNIYKVKTNEKQKHTGAAEQISCTESEALAFILDICDHSHIKQENLILSSYCLLTFSIITEQASTEG